MFARQQKAPAVAYLKQVATGVSILLLGIGIGMMHDGSGLRQGVIDGVLTLSLLGLLVAAVIAAIKAVKRSPSGSFGGWVTVLAGVIALMVLVSLGISGAVLRPEIPRANVTALAFVSAIAFVLWTAGKVARTPDPVPQSAE